jgi:hypothetical protein
LNLLVYEHADSAPMDAMLSARVRMPIEKAVGSHNELDSWACCSGLLWTFSRTGPPEPNRRKGGRNEGPAPRACQLDTEVLSYQCSE